MWIEQALSESLKEDPYIKEGTPLEGGMLHDQSASGRVTSNCSVYQKNEIFLEVFGQFEGQRGILGFAVSVIPGAIIGFYVFFVGLFVDDWIRGQQVKGSLTGGITFLPAYLTY